MKGKMAYRVSQVERGQNGQNGCGDRTSLEKCGIALLIIAILIIVGLTVGFIFAINENKATSTDQQPQICSTPGCIEAASLILNNIDESVNPCDDFYRFACGGFLKTTIIPDDKIQITSFTTLDNKVEQQLRTVIEQPVSPNEPRPFKLVKKLYRICMNTTAIETDSLPTLKRLIEEFGGWPVVEGKSWKEQNFDWQKAMGKFRKHGVYMNNFISIGVQADLKDSSRNVIMLDEPDLEIPRESFLNRSDPVVKVFYNYMVKLAVYFGADRDLAEKEMNTMIEFRSALADITLPAEQRRNKTALYNPMPIKRLTDYYPGIAWLELINSIIGISDKSVTEDDIVVVVVPDYFRRLSNLLSKISKRVQANYMICQAIRSLEFVLPQAIRDLEQEFTSIILGTRTRSPKWEECTMIVKQLFSHAVGVLYVRQYFNENSKKAAVEMVSNIQKEFIKILKEVDWMDESTKQTAIRKAETMTSHIAYPDELADDSKLVKYYEKLNVDTDNYVYFIANFSSFILDKSMEKLWKKVNKNDWTKRTAPTIINAFYSPADNSIEFPAAVLQGLFFNKDRLHSMNYGAIGTVIGHEITHGFDDMGKQYDQDGNLNNWWAEKTDKSFMEKAQCIIDQYSKYEVAEIGLRVNGIITQGENIADNGGVREAYLAYKSWMESNGEEPQLPGLNYTAKQLFWISNANVWCRKDRVELLKQLILTNNHAPNQYRVIGPLSNSEFFSEDFHCSLGSKMNPKHKCKVW